MSADKTSVERNGAICYNIFKFKKHGRYNLSNERLKMVEEAVRGKARYLLETAQ